MNQIFGEVAKFSLDGRLQKAITFIAGVATGIVAPKVIKAGKNQASKAFEKTSKKADEIIKNAETSKKV